MQVGTAERRSFQLLGGARERRSVARILWLAACALAALLLVVEGVIYARPQVVWELNAADNQMSISMAPGEGPLADWLLSESSLSSGGIDGRQILTTVPAGTTTDVDVTLNSLWPTAQTISVRVPPRPELISASLDAHTLVVIFTTAITPLNQPCGLPEGLGPVPTLVFPRGLVACSATLYVQATSGEIGHVSITVPAMPPPPPPSPSPTPSVPPQPRPLPMAPAVYFGNPNGGAIYITIDDGYAPDQRVIDLMKQQHVPITAFPIANIAAGNLAFWRSFIAAGGDLENHTVSHPDMTLLTEAQDRAQWVAASNDFRTWFRVSPALGRPPYGSFNTDVQIAAGQAGLRRVVLWSASMYNGVLTTYDHGPLRAGEIVILHWIPGMYDSLVKLLQIAASRGLHAAPLLGAV